MLLTKKRQLFNNQNDSLKNTIILGKKNDENPNGAVEHMKEYVETEKPLIRQRKEIIIYMKNYCKYINLAIQIYETKLKEDLNPEFKERIENSKRMDEEFVDLMNQIIDSSADLTFQNNI